MPACRLTTCDFNVSKRQLDMVLNDACYVKHGFRPATSNNIELVV